MTTTPGNSAVLAYEDPNFLDSEDGRPVRILAEYLGPCSAFARPRYTTPSYFSGRRGFAPTAPWAAIISRRTSLHGSSPCGPRACPPTPIATSSARAVVAASWRRPTAALRRPAARTIGLNISLPHEQRPNAYVTRELSLEFHYFFMRKLWFAHLARALVAFPGGFGTLDELTEILTLAQTRKLEYPIPVILYGSAYWREILNFEALARHGMIDRAGPRALPICRRSAGGARAAAGSIADGFQGSEPALCALTNGRNLASAANRPPIHRRA